ncbi:hypothetical protein EDB19DRAFT_1828663 [Suillus lakei]|nr:hypothetical protein EDB19DRAFT_1828663 [Suillus lakei]
MAVLKSHTTPASKASFAGGQCAKGKAYRTSPSKRYLISLKHPGGISSVHPTDRIVAIFDLRVSSLSSSTGITSGKQLVVTGAYDGVARLWLLQSTKGAVINFRAWLKVLVAAWVKDVVAIGGEG